MNPFNPDQPARDSSFVSRRAPLELVVGALSSRTLPLLVVGLPRMGKTSLIVEATQRMGDAAPQVARVDVSTASTLADVATRLLRSATVGLKPREGEAMANTLANAVGVRARLRSDVATGLPAAQLDGASRALPTAAQRELLTTTLDALNQVAAEEGREMAVVFEGLERLEGIGGQGALWQLREALGRQTHLRKLLTTRDAEAASGWTEPNGPLADWGNTLTVESIPGKRLRSWIRREARAAGTRITKGAASDIVEIAGTRTGDVVRLAAATFEFAEGRKIGRRHVTGGVHRLVREMSGWFRSDWCGLTPRQQNLTRALAAGETRPFAAAVRGRYDLRSTAAVARSLELLMQKGLVCRSKAGYSIDNPFFRHWVEQTALPDIGPTS